MPQITHSSELMTNYLQAQVMRPETGIQAVQAEDGRALLLSIGTDDALYGTIEQPGGRTGWERHDLSKDRIAADFAGRTDVKCTSFAVAQVTSFAGGRGAAKVIHLAMVIRDGGTDRLYLSLNNSASDTGWIARPNWAAYPYDDRGHSRPVLQIADVYLSEATDDTYIVVDVIRDPSSARKLRFRYYIDPAKPDGQAWQAHDVPVDVEDKGHQSALGRRWSKGRFQVDGIYTAGQVGGAAQLTYTPLYNVFDPDNAPKPTILHLPGNAVPDAIATCRNADNTSDLYVAASGTLYYFASTNQDDNAACIAVAKNPLFNGVRSLFAFLCDAQTVMVWGLSGSNQIFYTTCKLAELGQAYRWSPTVPILSAVEQVTPFVNRAYSATCFFAHAGENTLVKAVKSPSNLLWSFTNITLPPPDAKAKARSFDSYTTRVMVKDDDGMPLGHTKVKLSTSGALTVVYVNHLYHIVGPHPIEVETDVAGALTLVEAARTLTATQFRIDAGGSLSAVNPMERPLRTLAGLTTERKLTDATIRFQDGSTKRLIPGSVAPNDLAAIADANAKMGQVYDSFGALPGPVLMTGAAALTTSASARPMVVAELHGGIIADIGDFFAWLGDCIRRGFETAIEFVRDVAGNIWTAVVRIAGEIYRVALKVVEDIVEFAAWVYSKIKVAVEDVIKYLSYIFDIDDMRRTKDVFKHTVKLYLNHQVENIDAFKRQFDKAIDDAQKEVRSWAGLSPSWSGLGAEGNASIGQTSSYQHSDSAAGSFLTHHYQGNAGNTDFGSASAGHEPSLLDPLLTAVKQEYAAIQGLVGRVEDLAKELPRLSGVDILKRLLGIIAEFGLASVKAIADALLDVLKIVISEIVKALDKPLYIPVVSEILEAFGVPKFSILDVLCWIAAAPATIVYKIATSKTPFPDNPHTRDLLASTTFDALVALFRATPSPEPVVRSLGAAAVNGGQPPLSDIKWVNDNRYAFHIIGQFTSGLFAIMPGAILDAAEVMAPARSNPFSKHSTAVAVLVGGANAIATTISPHHPLEDPTFITIGRATTGLRFGAKLLFGGWGVAVEKAANDPEGDRAFLDQLRIAGAVVDVILMLPALAVSIKHFVELGKIPASGKRSIAIVNEVGNLTGYVGRIAYLGAASTEGVPKGVFVGIMAGATVCTGGLLIADAFIKP